MSDDTIVLPDDPASAWAAPAAEPLIGDRVRELLAQVFHAEPVPPVPTTAEPPPSALTAADLAALGAAVGQAHVETGDRERGAHANGMSYLDLVRREGGVPALPDAVVLPGTDDEVVALLAVCADRGIAVVPFGGGTSVVGGVTPGRGAFHAVVALDLRRFDRLVEVDDVSRTATFEAGVLAPRAEELLAEHGFTLGHLPQSFERATIGGFAATRSAGSLSTGWGRFDDMVERVRTVTPVGVLDLGRAPGTAAGPDLRQLVLGSEGAFGVITRVTVHVRPIPEVRRHEGWRVASFAEGVALLRRVAQDGPLPDMARLSDETETALGVATGGEEAGEGCLMVIGWEGGADDVARRAEGLTRIFTEAGATSLGEEAAASWQRGRFRGPRLRDELLREGILAETLETSAVWRDLEQVHAAVGAAVSTALEGSTPLVACHVSHLYPAGASLYFSVLARRADEDPVGQWIAAKRAAGDALAANGATITHHHAVGEDHAPWMTAEVGEAGVELLRAVKAHLDPAGILNPGKLIPPR
jgi:alkyldihydroxyacetonephosphate synthase